MGGKDALVMMGLCSLLSKSTITKCRFPCLMQCFDPC